VKLPDVVANLRIDQAWGSAQIAAAAHHIYGTTATAGYVRNQDDWGWAVQAGVNINLPMLAAGDVAFLQAGYSDGAIGYMCQNCFNFRSLGADAVIANGGALKTTTAWAISGGMKHNFSAQWEANLDGGYASVDGYGARDYDQYEIAADLRWKPAAGLTIGLAAEYRNIDFSNATTSTHTGIGGSSEANAKYYQLRDGDAWMLGLRVQRFAEGAPVFKVQGFESFSIRSHGSASSSRLESQFYSFRLAYAP